MTEPSTRNEGKQLPKILYAASTASHLRRFHMPYIERLRESCEVKLMAKGEGVDYSIRFEKSMTSPANFKAIREIRRILKAERFDAVILNTMLAAFLIRMAMRGMKKRPRVLNIVHGYLFELPPKGMKQRLMLQCEKLVKKQTDGIAVMNGADLEILARHRLCVGDTRLIRGMGYRPLAELPVRDAELRQAYAPDRGDILLTFVGELSRRKNQIALIRATDALRREGIPIRLLLVGEGDERKALEAEVADRGLADAVFLIGNREPVLPYLAVTDVYVSASRIEGLPFNLMEAMACGLPIVASDVKGQQDLLADHPASLYPLEDETALCAAIRQAIGGRLGMEAVDYPILGQYRLDAVLEENIDLMRSFIL